MATQTNLAAKEVWREVRQRQQRSQGIGLAVDYLNSVAPYIGQNPESYFGLGSSKQWQDALKRSTNKLVFPCSEKVSAVAKKKDQQNPDKPASGILPGACIEFDCILTTGKQDRDRDILDPEGAVLDEYMPLLWQHIPIQPVGKMLKLLQQDKNTVKIRCAVIDNAFGNDVAGLIEFGALRISHGFIPIKWEPLEDEQGEDQMFNGWHVLKYNVLEVSVVSIPSNTDATITQYSCDKLHSPLVKSWANGLAEARTKTVSTTIPKKKGAGMATPVNVTVNIDPALLKGLKAPTTPTTDGDKPADKPEDRPDDKPKDDEVSDMASYGRVHLMLEQAMAIEGMPEEATKILGQAIDELQACMKADMDEEEKNKKEQAEGEDDVEPGDSNGRADEEDDKSLADEIFQRSLRKHAKK